jgi:hypothetical protein
MDGIEPIDDGPSPCRQAALAYSRVIFAVDEFMATATDARLNWVATSIALQLTSVRQLTLPEIGGQLGVSEKL